MRQLVIFLYAIMFLLSASLAGINTVTSQAPISGTIVCSIPPEPVLRNGPNWVAKQVTGTVTVKIGANTYTGTLTFPDVTVRRTGIGSMQVDACVATGFLK
jgi:hypothetical protein